MKGYGGEGSKAEGANVTQRADDVRKISINTFTNAAFEDEKNDYHVSRIWPTFK